MEIFFAEPESEMIKVEGTGKKIAWERANKLG